MFCKKCGTVLQDGTQFCTKCGARTASEPSVPNVTVSVNPSQQGAKAVSSQAVSSARQDGSGERVYRIPLTIVVKVKPKSS